jgi:hypothetical protein
MENIINIKQVIQKLTDVTGAEMIDFGKLELHLRNAYVGTYMPESNFMEGDEKVKELCFAYYRQLLYDFWHSLKVTGDNLYLLGTGTQEGIAFKLLANGAEVWEELEKHLLNKAIAHIRQVGKEGYKLRTQIDRIAMTMLMYADLHEKARKIKCDKEATKFYKDGKNKLFRDLD